MHNVTITHGTTRYREDKPHTIWQARCTDCPWRSRWYPRRRDAQWYADEHELDTLDPTREDKNYA